MSDFAVRVEKLSKRYRIGKRQDDYQTLRDQLANSVGSLFRRKPDGGSTRELWALRDVSLEVQRGEAVGIIGRNGAGKSTLLKILSHITEPTSGRVLLRGRVGSLLEVGTGFNMELTGRENVYLNGAILGMKRVEIRRKFDEIIEFAGVEEFLDTPVKRYSSGMFMRLAFSVAAHLEPDILVVDEVLAVGDAAFQKKCLGKMDDVAKSGRTVLFVSHHMPPIQALCKSVLMLEAGQLVRSGPPDDVIPYYLESGVSQTSANVDLLNYMERRKLAHPVLFTRLRLLDSDGSESPRFWSGTPIVFELSLDPHGRTLKSPLIIISVSWRGNRICVLDTRLMINDLFTIDKPATIRCVWEPGWLAGGTYTIGLKIKSTSNGEVLDSVPEAASFDIEVADLYGTGRTDAGSVLFPKGRWEL